MIQWPHHLPVSSSLRFKGEIKAMDTASELASVTRKGLMAISWAAPLRVIANSKSKPKTEEIKMKNKLIQRLSDVARPFAHSCATDRYRLRQRTRRRPALAQQARNQTY